MLTINDYALVLGELYATARVKEMQLEQLSAQVAELQQEAEALRAALKEATDGGKA
jgi:prefoldin subunit 5